MSYSEDVLDQQRSPYCMLCKAEHESCLDTDEEDLWVDLDLFDEDDEGEEDWDDDYE